ncbi:MAG: Rho termination factor N-terminal domain-containing protein [Prolixibacteraceae bacterium]|nr:Rho termination factor N-terminal domain-containing protein [Prolixibacteraceae bacterium]
MSKKNKIPQIKNEEQYEALRDKGYSKQKAARIANTPDAGERGGKSKKYEEWTKKELYKKAAEIGISGRSKMSKKELIAALRNN